MAKMSRILPLDVIVELLSRLPVKSLCRFRCVSKQWMNLISSSALKHLHHNRFQKTPFPLVWKWICSLPARSKESRNILLSIDAATERSERNFKLIINGNGSTKFNYLCVSSCHGLVCLSSPYDRKVVHVWNPSTRELVNLPDPPNAHREGVIGFGYISATNQYKIIHWHWLFDDCVMRCDIFTLTDGGRASSCCWRENTNRLTYLYLEIKHEHICVEGVIYWLVHKDDGSNLKSVLAFELEREEFKIIPIPEIGGGHASENLMEVRGSVCLGKSRRGGVMTWMLMKGQWVPGFNIRHRSIRSCSVQLLLYLSSSRNEDEKEEVVFRSGNRVLYFDTKRKTVRRSINMDRFGFERDVYPCKYVDTLFSIQGK